VGEFLAAEEVLREFVERTFDLADVGFALEDLLAVAPDLQLDGPCACVFFGGADFDALYTLACGR
jgi:hypothetical protein